MSDVDNDPQTTRRQALRRIALFGLAACVAPSVLTISEAEAGGHASKSKSDTSSKNKSDRQSKYDCKEEEQREPTPPRGTDCGSYDNPDRCVIRKRDTVVEVSG